MVLVKFSTDSIGPRLGIRRGNRVIAVEDLADDDVGLDATNQLQRLGELESMADDYISGADRTYESLVENVTLHCPVDPGKIIRIEGCYQHHVDEEQFDPFLDPDLLGSMSWPRLWSAPLSSMIGPNGTVVLPEFAQTVRPGVELAFVVGQKVKYLDEAEAMQAIAGYIVMGDIGIFDELPGQWGYKFFDTALPIGASIASPEPSTVDDLDLTLKLNGEIIDTESTANWRFRAAEMVSSVSEMMTLRPGDLVSTGNPMRPDETLQEGDVITCEVQNVGSITVDVTRDQSPSGVRI